MCEYGRHGAFSALLQVDEGEGVIYNDRLPSITSNQNSSFRFARIDGVTYILGAHCLLVHRGQPRPHPEVVEGRKESRENI